MRDKLDNTRDFYNAKLVYYLTWLLFLVSSGLFTLGLFVSWLTATNNLLLLVPLSLTSLYLLSRGQTKFAALLLVSTMWLFITYIMLTRGIYTPANYAYMILILLAGTLFNERAVLITSVMSAIATFMSGLLTAQAYLTASTGLITTAKIVTNPAVIYADTFGGLVNLAFFALLTYMTVRQTHLAFATSEENRQLLNTQNKELGTVNEQLRHEIEGRTHYEQALQTSEQRFRELFEGAPIMYVVTAPDEQNQPHIKECNQLFLTLLGHQLEDVVGRPLADFYTEQSKHVMATQGGYGRIMQNETVEGERELLTAVGKTLPVWLRAIPKYNNHGRVIGTRAMYVDISSLKQAQLQANAYNQQLATMHRLHVEMTRTLDLDQVANTLLDNLRQELNADYASLFLIEDYFRTLAETYDYKDWQHSQRGQLVMVNPHESPILSKIVSNKTSLIIADTAVHPHWIKVVGAEKVRSFLAVPLLVDDEVVAFCGLDKNQPNYFTVGHLRLVESLAGQAAMALENTRLHTILQNQAANLERRVVARTAELEETNLRLWNEVEERRQMQAQLIIQNQQLSIMRHIGLELASQLELSQLLGMIVSSAIELMAGDGGRLYLVHEEQEEQPEGQESKVSSYLRARVTTGPSNVPPDIHLRRGESVSGRIWDTRQAIIIHHYPAWEHLFTPNSANLFQSVLGVPILSQEDVLGVILIVAEDAHAFSPDDVTLLELLAAHAAVAIRNAQLHEQIQHYTDQLEQRVWERTQDLITANLKLRELDELKTKFIHDMSHELRTPVTNLGLYLDLLERKPEKLDSYAITLRLQFERLRELVQQVVEMSELEVGASGEKLQLVEILPLLERMVVKQQARAKARQVTLQYIPTTAVPPVLGDKNRLEQMLAQLLDNALKYTNQGSIMIWASHDLANNNVLIEIQDSGIGIPAHDLPHIFESFYRGQNVSQLTIPGTGLGLTTARAIADIHNGHIEIQSELDSGTAVQVTLPAAPKDVKKAKVEGQSVTSSPLALHPLHAHKEIP